MSGRVTYNPATGRCQWAQYSASPGRALYNANRPLSVYVPNMAMRGWKRGVNNSVYRDWVECDGPHTVTWSDSAGLWSGETVLYDLGYLIGGGYLIGKVTTTIERKTDENGRYWEMCVTMEYSDTSPHGWVKATNRSALTGPYTYLSSSPATSDGDWRIDGPYSVSVA